jgi:signal transduction histidine kinase
MQAVGISFAFIAAGPVANCETNQIQMQSVLVNGQHVSISSKETVNLGSFPENIDFYFWINTNINPIPVRIRYKLAGYDSDWQDNNSNLNGEMNLTVRFYNDKDDIVSETPFAVSGQSLGWTGSLKTSSLTHRRETLVVPPQASKLMVVISSAGPPQTVGVYAVANLVVSKSSGNSGRAVLLQFPLDRQLYGDSEANDALPYGWVRDGVRPSMAKIVQLGEGSDEKAFAILDDSVIAHAEWHNNIEQAPNVTPGDRLVIEWNEMYSIGMGNTELAVYKKLSPGNFRFRVEAVDIMGNPTGAQLSLAVHVPLPFWKTFWFWGVAGVTCVAMALATGRYITLYKMQREVARLRNQRAIEVERLRIARDIHDDLGARVTQISLLSAVACDNPKIQQEARIEFNEISRISRDLISALYETVWAVNPENDNLEALGNYICQIVTKLSENAGYHCRFIIDRLPRNIEVPSQSRHSISLVAKEAIHNVIKHAAASLVTVQITFSSNVLTISIQDNGHGFQTTDIHHGSGLRNMEQRMKDLGGTYSINSQAGSGTDVVLRLNFPPTDRPHLPGA